MVYLVEESDQVIEGKSAIVESKSFSSIPSSDTEQELSDIFSDTMNIKTPERVIAVKDSKPLARRSVLYLGAAIPAAAASGIDSIQEPLSKRYPINDEEHVCGIEAWLSIDENGLQIQFRDDPSMMLYYPLRSLVYCASVRYVKHSKSNGRSSNGYRFVSLEDPETDLIQNARNPPIFAVTLQRTRHLPVNECHCFVTKTKNAALELVEACFDAYQSTDSDQDLSKTPLYFKIGADGATMKETDRGIYIAPASDRERLFNYQCSREADGFFYKTDKVLIKCWELSEHHGSADRQTLSEHSSSSRSSHYSHQRDNKTTVPEKQQAVLQSPSSGHSNEQLATKHADPYTPIANSSRVQRIKDPSSGRDVYVRWMNNMPSIPEQLTQTSSFETVANSRSNNAIQKQLSSEIVRLALTRTPPKPSIAYENKPSIEPPKHDKKKSSKKNHRKHKHQNPPPNDEHSKRKSSTKKSKQHRSRYDETYYPSPTSNLQQKYPTPSVPLPQQDYSKASYPQQYYSNSSYIQPEYKQPIYPQPSFSSASFPVKPSYTPQIFSYPIDPSTSFSGKPLPQTASYVYHTLQPYLNSSNSNSTTPYWFYTM
ncbi:unnamed protein product [Adineta ricciae]|uniref:Uncharacterized protein n=1 Tax=Adineta ricciae TaxID=249248 RepID=A0A813XB30_ADIRI|nr:unnamed protein product [Adineta ricciae]